MSSQPQFLAWSATCNGAGECVVLDDGRLAPPFGSARIVVAAGSQERVIALLEAGAAQVLAGEAALRDGTLVARLAARYGSARIGVYVPVCRAAVSWSLDPHTNADFTCLVTTMPVPRWDALMADGQTTGTDAIWWAEQMVAAGASTVLIAAEPKEEDLLLAAECVERVGEPLWFASQAENADLVLWIELAGARRFVTPRGVAAVSTEAAA